ncbi:MAG: GDSL-type esterase/lipase family protein [Flavobacteriaceae bacterium]
MIGKNNFKFLILLTVILLLSSCAPIKVACVGDSITYGASIKHRDSLSYPVQLQRLLDKKYKVANFGHSGATMLKKGDKPYWDLPEYQQSLDFEPKVIVLMLGTNDSKPQNWDKFKNEFITDYQEMINNFQNLKSKPTIYIGLPPPVIKESWGIRKEIVEVDLINILNNISTDHKLKIIDLQSVFKGKDNLIPDGIHPNGAGAKLMAETIYKTLIE